METENLKNQTSEENVTPQSTVANPSTTLLHTLAPIFVILAAIFWGILVVFVRAFGKAEFASMEIVTMRVYSSAIFAWIFLLLFDRNSRRQRNLKNASNAPSTPQPTPKTTFRLRDSWCFIGTGLVSIVFFSFCYFRNVEVSSAAVAATLMYTSPIFVTLLSALLFKEKLTKTKLIALILAIVGCALVCGIAGGIVPVPSTSIAGVYAPAATPGIAQTSTDGLGTPSFTGIALGLGSGIGYALYSIFGRFALNKGYSPFFVTAMTFTFACVGVLPFIKMTALATRLINEPKYILLALVMGLVGSCTPFALYTLGLRYMEASKAAILATLEPIVTALVGTFCYKEPIDLFTVIGIAMVLIAGILCSRPGKRGAD